MADNRMTDNYPTNSRSTDNPMFDLADRLKNLRDSKASLEAAVKEANAAIEETEYHLSELMAETETQNFTRSGVMFSLTTKTRASAVAGGKASLFDALRANGYGDLVYETVNANSLSSFVKEQMEENGGEVPDWLSGKVNVFEKTTVAVRKSTKQ